ncbi:hypothetical protein QBC37DRAFT_411221 [Rhypophila decipiens]|uniref:Secreted protein n=1 Tax=Rhypophila decipiens TaxID=261697 RepID=A0AAN6YI39_9PEZI|nr:hypothetical protein QBC37DRAFT_411221 [Rhypophila decipiens]
MRAGYFHHRRSMYLWLLFSFQSTEPKLPLPAKNWHTKTEIQRSRSSNHRPHDLSYGRRNYFPTEESPNSQIRLPKWK